MLFQGKKIMHILGIISDLVQAGQTLVAEAYVDAYTTNAFPNCVVKKCFWIDKLVFDHLLQENLMK